jgi:peptidyl-prolyl cis-trans isomerase-like 1
VDWGGGGGHNAGATHPRWLQVRVDTSLGTFMVELYHRHAPTTVANFLGLAGKGYYDGVPFHRVVRDFVIQGGDPTGTGRGGDSLWGGPFADEIHPELHHTGAGVLSMANAGERTVGGGGGGAGGCDRSRGGGVWRVRAGPGTNKSQFFVTLAPTPHLDGKHTVFGRVCSGMEVVKAIGSVPVGAGDRPVGAVVMTRVTVVDAGSG